jgi:hypothetical protein
MQQEYNGNVTAFFENIPHLHRTIKQAVFQVAGILIFPYRSIIIKNYEVLQGIRNNPSVIILTVVYIAPA